jgi:hypothetical protein
MKLKLTKSQMNGLHLLISVLLDYDSKSLLILLLQELVEKINERLRNKIRKAENSEKLEHSFSLNSIEAKAFYCWYYNMRESLTWSESLHYERGVADHIFNQIDKEHA